MVKNLPAAQVTQVQSLGQEDPLEKEIATHSRVLAWRIPWTEEPGWPTVHGLTKSQTLPSMHACMLHASRQSAQTPREDVFVELLEQKGPCHQVNTSFSV